MKKLAIITGSSRGLGLFLAQRFLDAGYTVIGIARNNSIKHPQFHFLKLELVSIKNISDKLSTFLKRQKISLKNEYVVLVNNAATVLPINYIHKLRESEIHSSYMLNLQAPMLLSQFVLQKFLAKSNHISICNVSSGAAIRPLMNWATYCCMKSGLKMFTDCLNLEYAESNKVKAFGFYPGVMDTKMQETIRKQTNKNFKNVEYFKELKEKNNLLDPKMVAHALFEVINKPLQINQTEYNIKDLEVQVK